MIDHSVKKINLRKSHELLKIVLHSVRREEILAFLCLLFLSSRHEEGLYQIFQNLQGSKMVNLLKRVSGNTYN